MKAIKHINLRNQGLITSFGRIVLDEDGVIVDPILTDEQFKTLLNIPNFILADVEEKEEVEEEVEKGVELSEMKVKDLKLLAKENNIELESTKKADIIKELEEKLSL